MEEVFLKVGEGNARKTGDDEHDEAIDIQQRLRVQGKPKAAAVQQIQTRESVPLLDNRGSPAMPTSALPLRNTGAMRKAQQFKAMLLKRIRNTMRSKWTALVQVGAWPKLCEGGDFHNVYILQ